MCKFINSIRERDPANPTFFEVVLAYPGYHAVMLHKVSHFLWNVKLRALGRFWSHLSRFLTGIEIHPQATIGKYLFIDHGMGVVIGATAEIGDNVTLYHGVTLGGRDTTEEGKRHPTIKDDVMIGSGAQVLGPITLNKNSRVGANAVVTKDVPENCTAVGNPARLIDCDQKSSFYGLPYNSTPDPVGDTINILIEDVKRLKEASGLQDDDNNKPDQLKRHKAGNWRGNSI